MREFKMNKLVRINRDEDGELTGRKVWCLVDPSNEQGPAAFCTQEFFGPGESSCEYEVKEQLGGITCEHCIEKLKILKAVRIK